MKSENDSADANRPDPGAMPGSGIDLARLREHVENLLDQAVTDGVLVTVESRDSTEREDADVADSSGESQEEELVEVTADQLDALNAAHDALADALASLDSGRK